MTDLLLRLAGLRSADCRDSATRAKIGSLSGAVGIGANVLLFTGKLLAGILTGSVSITADAMNNLSDASSSIVTLLGFKLASSPRMRTIPTAMPGLSICPVWPSP